ncbi:MAG: hypothetical protein V4550_08190 [Gemmatimonadota bacterium]
MLQELGAELAHTLSAKDLDLITRHYFQQVPQIVIAKQLAIVRGIPVKTAEGTVNQWLLRARRRLKRRLGPRWAVLIKEML